MQPLYTSVTMKKNDPFFVLNNCNICRQCNLKEKTELQCETDRDELLTIKCMGQIFSDEAQKSVTSVYNALYKEKLCNHCIQV